MVSDSNKNKRLDGFLLTLPCSSYRSSQARAFEAPAPGYPHLYDPMRGHALETPFGRGGSTFGFPTDHVRGSPLAKVTLIGYGDFSNPDCARTYRTVQEIEKRMGSRLRYVFRCFPEPLEFANAEESAEAAECAASQGRSSGRCTIACSRPHVGVGRFSRGEMRGGVGLDVPRFRREMRGHVHLAKIRAGRNAGLRRGVVRAPALFINSLRHESSFGLTTLLRSGPGPRQADHDPETFPGDRPSPPSWSLTT